MGGYRFINNIISIPEYKFREQEKWDPDSLNISPRIELCG